MAPRWSWDFEDDRAPGTPAPGAAPPAQPPAVPPGPPPAGREPDIAQIRRRRGAAVVILLLIVVAGVSALAGSSHHARAKSSRAAAPRAHSTPIPVEGQEEGEAAVRSVLAYTPFVKQGGAKRLEVALTFDDGPGPYTPQILDVLERFHVHATFFEVGRMLPYFGSSTERQIADGDVIGDHTEDHPALAKLSAHDQREQLFEQIARVELAGGHREMLFRPPYGSFDATTVHVLHAMRLLMVLWSVDTHDYERPGVAVIVERALAGVEPGAILLMHDAGGERAQTVAALPQIIRGIRARGYDLVTIPQLLHDDPPPPGQPLPPSLAGAAG